MHLRRHVVLNKSRVDLWKARLSSTAAFVLLLVFLNFTFGKQPRASPKNTQVVPVISHRVYTSRSFSGAAIYTPYHLTPGGGERVLLKFAKKFQELHPKQKVYFVVEKDNVCKRVSCLKSLGSALDVKDIEWARVRVIFRKHATPTFDIWLSMGNDLLPRMPSLGRYAIYHCQFPFMGANEIDTMHLLEQLSTYDVVYLNSEYTYNWYKRFLSDVHLSVQPHRIFRVPTIVHFPPPFNLHTSRLSDLDATQKVEDRRRGEFKILLVGRFFTGRQNKGHLEALKAFDKLRVKVPHLSVHLTFAGHIHSGAEKYAERIKRLARKKNDVTVRLNLSARDLRDLIDSADIVWSITGLRDHISRDPADAEHFGLALLECMSAGLVPVVFRKGGPAEIAAELPELVKVASIGELAEKTATIMSLSQEDFAELSSNSKQIAEDFSDGFDEGIEMLFTFLGEKLTARTWELWFSVRSAAAVYRSGLQAVTEAVESCPSINDDTKAIIYMDDRFDFALQATAGLLSTKLGSDWRLHVWHTKRNAAVVRQTLADLSCVVYHSLDTLRIAEHGIDPRQEGGYQQIWKSTSFLSAIGTSVRHVLTFQADAWFPPHSSFDSRWLETDYIGAPWCLENNWGFLDPQARPEKAQSMLHDTRQIPRTMRVGNGGVSLRNLEAMKHVVQQHSTDSSKQENEDVFFVYFLAAEGYSVATLQEAERFSLEILCPDVEGHIELRHRFPKIDVLPFALHKPFDIFRQLHGGESFTVASARQLVTIFF